MDSFWPKAMVWDYYILMLDLFQMLSSPDVNWWTGLLCCFFVLFLSDSHSDGTHSLQSIHYWDTFLQIWWKNKLILISDDKIFLFGWTIALSSNSPSRASPCISNRSLFVIITTILLAQTSIKLLHKLLARFTKDCSIYNSSLTQLNRYLTRLGYTGFIASVLDHYKTTKFKQI